MKKKEREQLKNKSVEELKKSLREHQEKLWSLKVDLKSGKVKNVREIHLHKKAIARILTIANNDTQHGK